MGIPAGGLFTGAEEIKTAAQAAIYGGTGASPTTRATTSCATMAANVNSTALEQMADAAAHATLPFAMTTSSPNGTSKASGNASKYKGSLLLR